MNSNNIENAKIISSKGEKNVGRRTEFKSPYKNDKLASSLNINIQDMNITLPNREMNYMGNSTNNFLYDIKEGKKNITSVKKNISSVKKNTAYLSKINNNINFDFSDNTYMFPVNNREISVYTDTGILNSNNNNIKAKSKNNKTKVLNKISMQNMKTKNITDNSKLKNMIVNNNINNSIVSSSPMINDNLSYRNEQYDSKYSIKINKIKDDYIDFLQKEFEDNTKKSVKLDSNNKELLKKCDDLIHDNLILSNTLKERNSQLNKIIQENLMVKTQLDKSILNNQKNEQKLEYYEEQFNLFKSSNDNYQKIIKELKEQNDKLNANLVQMEKANQVNLKNEEEKHRIQLKEEIEKTKNKMGEAFDNKIREINEKNESKNKALIDQMNELKDQNGELIKELNNKTNMFDLVCKENEKITNENNLFRTQVEQYSKQINELNTIISHKDNIINNLKAENLNNEKFLNKSSSCSMMKYDGSEYLNENISKLISDNEENKMKIELLNDKLKSIDEIERKYNEIMNGSRTLSLSEKLAYQINTNSKSPDTLSTNLYYNNNTLNSMTSNIQSSRYKKNPVNKTYNSNTNTNTNNKNKNYFSPKKLRLNVSQFNDMTYTPEIIRNKIERKDFNANTEKEAKQKNRNNNVVVYTSNVITRDNKRKNARESTINNINNTEKKEINKNNIDREIKVTKKPNKNNEKDNKNISKTRKVEIMTTPIKIRYNNRLEDNSNKDKDNLEEKRKRNVHGKDLEPEKDEVKESIRQMNRKKNYTHKAKNNNYSLEESKNDQKKEGTQINISHSQLDKVDEETKEKQNDSLYLYGIDRNDVLHIFDINNKLWCENKKIYDLEDKSETFKKDYQYEGTLIYNTLYGFYILTGQKTDILYYFNSQTNSISKVCRFNYSHDNGSLMLDSKNNCLYVFGGKKIKACEYYSFSEKKVYKLPDLITDRANASFIISNNKIFGFFGYCYSKDNYAKTIEYMDYKKIDKWYELNNIKFLKDDISFDIESVSTMYFKQNQSQILIYCGIQGEEEEFVTEYYLLYDSRNNSMDKIEKWNMHQYKGLGRRWKNYNLKKNDPKGFHFAKNTRFLLLPKGNNYEGYNEKDHPIDIMIDYKNNVHFILQDKQKIDIYRSDM